jgi:hypothetical protein
VNLYISTNLTRSVDNERLLQVEVNLEAPTNKTYYIIESEVEE